jgi:hypothetical protein
MTSILAIHGISQARTTAPRLTADWRQALSRGIAKIPSQRQTPSLSVAYYARISSALHLGDTDHNDELLPSEEEVEFVQKSVAELLGPIDSDEINPLVERCLTLGPCAIWQGYLHLIVAIDDRWGVAQGLGVLRLLREAHKYLTDLRYADQVRSIVRSEFSERTQMLLAHSLGSVIALDLFLRGEVPDSVSTMVTFGSPLAWPTFRRGLGIDTVQPTLPDGFRWANVVDPRDAITGGWGLGDPLGRPNSKLPHAVDHVVDNGVDDPHSARLYLRHPKTAAEIIAALDHSLMR